MGVGDVPYARDIGPGNVEKGSVFVSAEVISIIASAGLLLAAVVGGFAWTITRMDARFAHMDEKIDTLRIDVEARFRSVEHELSEVKIAVARLEGPPPRLLRTR